MTVVTKPNIKSAQEKKEDHLKAALVSGADGTPVVDDVETGYSHERPASSCMLRSARSTLCVFVASLGLLIVAFIGVSYLIQDYQSRQIGRFRGWCGIPMERGALHLVGDQTIGGKSRFMNREFENGDAELIKSDSDLMEKGSVFADARLFREEFEMDLEDEAYEQIHVPDFGIGRKGRFVHDFKTNKTGIIDLSSKRCFVMPLDRSHVLPPRTMYDLVQKMWMGYYNIDTDVIRETMRVTRPAVTDFDALGVYISRFCRHYPTFILQRVDGSRHRRAAAAAAAAAPVENVVELVEFAGNKIIHFIIEDDPTDVE